MSKLMRLPSVIDIHVHLRDPGQTYKEDFYSGTAAALRGGITTVFDMPNNQQPILTLALLEEKIKIAQRKAVCDFGLYFGTDGKNINQFDKAADKVVGLKVYLGKTTGSLIIEDEDLLENVFKNWPRSKVIIIHAQADKIDLSIRLARLYGNKIHLTHLSTQTDLERVIQAKNEGLNISCDVTPHHLLLTCADEKKLGNLATVKPELAAKKDQQFLWQHLSAVDCIASDHAPHTLTEKKSIESRNGLPGLETMLPLLLTSVNEKVLSIDELVRLTSLGPQRIFGFRQSHNNIVEIDLDEKYTIQNGNLATKCNWSPFSNWKFKGKIKKVYLRDEKAVENDKILVAPGFGRNIITKYG